MTAIASPMPAATAIRNESGLTFKRMLALLFRGALVAVVLMVIGAVVAYGHGYAVPRVTTGSMEPAIMIGDYVVSAPAKVEDLAIGDVITYDFYPITVTHRVVGFEEDGSVIVKGDFNPVADETRITNENLRAKVHFVISGEHAKQLDLVIPAMEWRSHAFTAIFEGEFEEAFIERDDTPWIWAGGIALVILWFIVGTVRMLIGTVLKLIAWATRRVA